MSNTVFNSSRLVIPDQATGYYSIGSTFIESSPQSMTGVNGEAGLSSTVDDLLTWARALDAHTLISSASYRQMVDDARNNYGFGWELRTWSNRRMVGHAGSGPGFSNMVARFPDDGLTVVVLSNSDEASGSGTARALAGVFFGETPPLPTIQPKTLILDAILKDGVEAGIRRYQELKSRQPSAEAFMSDELIVEIGYELIGLPSMEAARRVFESALEMFPQSAYSHDGLADIAAAEGDVATAISQFEASLRLDPENQYAIDGLQRLRRPPGG
jgi:tetratricopeptide (TPR) repeat protein